MTTSSVLFAQLTQPTVALLLSQRRHENEALDLIIARNAKEILDVAISSSEADTIVKPQEPISTTCNGLHRAEVLGEIVTAATLGRLFAEVVDLINLVAPEALVRLSKTRARTRAYVAKCSADVHAGRTDLPTRKTRSGWYVSDNVGTADILRALKALAIVAELRFGKDICFG